MKSRPAACAIKALMSGKPRCEGLPYRRWTCIAEACPSCPVPAQLNDFLHIFCPVKSCIYRREPKGTAALNGLQPCGAALMPYFS